jgi:hypothetical protein
VDAPIDAGIAAFCDTCRACRKYCPPAAIPDDPSPAAGKDHLGSDYCSICLPVCVYNHKEWGRDFEGFERHGYEPLARERREHLRSGEGDHGSQHA